MRYVVCSLFLVLLHGCASFVHSDIKLKGNQTEKLPNNFEVNKVIKINATMIVGETRKEADNSTQNKEALQVQNELIKELEAYTYGLFYRNPNFIKRNARIHIEFLNRIIQSRSEKYWMIFSSLTLGVIPFWTDGEVSSRISFYIGDEQVYSNSYTDRYQYIQQTLLLPLIFKSQKRAELYLVRTHLDKFYDDLINRSQK